MPKGPTMALTMHWGRVTNPLLLPEVCNSLHACCTSPHQSKSSTQGRFIPGTGAGVGRNACLPFAKAGGHCCDLTEVIAVEF